MKTNYTIALQALKFINDTVLIGRGVCIEEAIPENSLLFIGINPSFDKNKDRVPGVEGYSPVYSLDGIDHTYFAKPMELAHNNSLPFGHHDLFPVRERNQKVIEGLFVD